VRRIPLPYLPLANLARPKIGSTGVAGLAESFLHQVVLENHHKTHRENR
jgi:hypothetical protein